MISKPPTTLYETLYPYINIDADVCEPNYVAALPIKPQHATSNPRFIHEQVINPDNKEMIEGIVKDMKGASAEDVYSVIVSVLIWPAADSRSVANSPRSSPSSEDVCTRRPSPAKHTTPTQWWHKQRATSRRSTMLVFQREYTTPIIIPNGSDRVCIKLPTTSAGVEAAAELKKAGIMSLGTCLFSVPQAVAASQAGMVAISMYFNGEWSSGAHSSLQNPSLAVMQNSGPT